MNPFTNLNQRGVALPKGYQNLADILQGTRCEYCDDVAVEAEGWPGLIRWCDACQQDLADFLLHDLVEHPPISWGEPLADARFELARQRREFDYMRARVRERKLR